jgi:type II secretory pathway pseudopilin PulG
MAKSAVAAAPIAVPRGRVGFVTMEALALISLLCIAAIFVYASYARQANEADQQALRLAKDLRPALEAMFREQPQAVLKAEALPGGVAVPAPLTVSVPPYKDRADDWQVLVSHPQGVKRYVISAQGIRETYR